jgi:hypothetical protein
VQDVARRWKSGEGRSLTGFKDRCQVTRRAVWAIKVIHPREYVILGPEWPRTGCAPEDQPEDKPQDEPADEPGNKPGNEVEEAGGDLG